MQSWAERRKPDAPGITDAMRAFIAASKDADTAFRLKADAAEQRVIRSRRLVAVATAAFVVLLIAGLAAWWQQDWLKERIYVLTNVTALKPAQEHALKAGDPFRECTHCPEMIVVPAGHLTMGSPSARKRRDEGPQHQVTIATPFAVSKFELTFDEWDACAAHGDCDPQVSASGWGRGRQPVINVTWDDAQRYVAWLSRITGKKYRLLSEAEYDYAARAGMQTAYPWGDDMKLNGKAMANCAGCGSQPDYKQTAPVGSFLPNAFGLYDMVGNVWEWMEDCSEEGTPPSEAWKCSANTRVGRGGSWDVYSVRPEMRYQDPSGKRSDSVGFRVARTLTP